MCATSRCRKRRGLFVGNPGSSQGDHPGCTRRTTNFGADPIAGRNAVLVKSLGDAVADLTKRLGSDMQQVGSGHIIIRGCSVPSTAAVRPDLEAQWDHRPWPAGRRQLHHQRHRRHRQPADGGFSFKIVMDTEEWDNFGGPEQSRPVGRHRQPTLRDLYELWARAKYLWIFYSRAKVESVAEQHVTMTPGKGRQNCSRGNRAATSWAMVRFLVGLEDHPMTKTLLLSSAAGAVGSGRARHGAGLLLSRCADQRGAE